MADSNAKDQKPQTTETVTTKADFVKLGHFDIALTYKFLPETIVFPCKLMLNEDDKAAKQSFYAQADGDKAKGQHMYHVDMMSRIVNGEPSGLPGFPVQGEVVRAADAVDYKSLPDRIREYFNTGEPILIKIAAEFIDLYNLKTTPPEFFQ